MNEDDEIVDDINLPNLSPPPAKKEGSAVVEDDDQQEWTDLTPEPSVGPTVSPRGTVCESLGHSVGFGHRTLVRDIQCRLERVDVIDP